MNNYVGKKNYSEKKKLSFGSHWTQYCQESKCLKISKTTDVRYVYAQQRNFHWLRKEIVASHSMEAKRGRCLQSATLVHEAQRRGGSTTGDKFKRFSDQRPSHAASRNPTADIRTTLHFFLPPPNSPSSHHPTNHNANNPAPHVFNDFHCILLSILKTVLDIFQCLSHNYFHPRWSPQEQASVPPSIRNWDSETMIHYIMFMHMKTDVCIVVMYAKIFESWPHIRHLI